ncbi:hypothetical protein [Achromobacter sp. B7]|nr:hypothetical protein [Achromobacter sp. B7]
MEFLDSRWEDLKSVARGGALERLNSHVDIWFSFHVAYDRLRA